MPELTERGMDLLAHDDDWAWVPQPVMPADVVADANAGRWPRRSERGECVRLEQDDFRRVTMGRMAT